MEQETEQEGGLRDDALLMARIAGERLAVEPVVLDLRRVASFCDYFVICHGRSAVHLDSIVDAVLEQTKKREVLPHHCERGRNAQWVILDFGGVVVHVFTAEARRFYNLEGLWADAEVVELGAEP